MPNYEHYNILKEGLNSWNPWRIENRDIIPDLSNCDLDGLYLSEFILDNVNFEKSRIKNCDLSEATMSNCKLKGVAFIDNNFVANDMSYSDLSHSSLSSERLHQTTLDHCILKNADLLFATLSDVTLKSTNFKNVRIGYTSFLNVDFRGAKNLETLIHDAPSSIGIDSLFKSQGEIPIQFLKSCGIPSAFIEYIPSLVNQSIQYYTCFISYSHKDSSFSNRLYNDLQANGIRCWLFSEDAKWGSKVWDEIDKHIKMYDKLLVICSRDSLKSSPVLREIERALHKEDKEAKNVLFPISIDDYLFDSWENERKVDVVNKVVGDFAGWDKNIAKYNTSLRRLIEGLKA